MWLLHITTTTL